MTNREDVQKQVARIVLACIAEATAQGYARIQAEHGESAQILDGGGFIDSHGLVSLLVTIEQDVEAEMSITMDLSSSLAAAVHRGANPLSTAATLIAHLTERIMRNAEEVQS
jgi:hypothetical protein